MSIKKTKKQLQRLQGGLMTRKEKSSYVQKIRNQQVFIQTFIQNVELARLGKERKNKTQIEEAVNNIQELFRNEYLNEYINTRIPIRSNRIPKLKEPGSSFDNISKDGLTKKQEKTMIVDYVSPLTVIFDNVPSIYQEQLLNEYIQAGGNINLVSQSSRRETPLSNEIDKNNIYSVSLLLKNNADTLSLSKDRSDKLVTMINDIKSIEKPVEELIEDDKNDTIIEQPLVQDIIDQQPAMADPLLNEAVIEETNTKEIVNNIPNIPEPEQQEEIVKNTNEIKEELEVTKPTVQENLIDTNKFEPNEYTPHSIPTYWVPVFKTEQNMTALKNRIMSILVQDDLKKSRTKKNWISCDIIERLFPSYFVKTEIIEGVKQQNNNLNSRSVINDEYNEYIIQCVLLLLLGIISEKMASQQYNFIFKGGKAIQLILSQIIGAEKYISDDIDILIVPQNIPYNREAVINVGKNLAYLLKWFVSFPTITTITPIDLSIKDAIVSNPTDTVVKLAIFKITGPKVLVDVGIHDIPEDVAIFFNNPQGFNFYIRELGEKALFKCPTFDSLVDEKIFYFIKYLRLYNKFFNNQPVDAAELKNVRSRESGMQSCDFFLRKFGRALSALFSEKLKEDPDYSKMNEFQKKFQKRTIAEMYLTRMNIETEIRRQVLAILGI
jgi:hypothetical protein